MRLSIDADGTSARVTRVSAQGQAMASELYIEDLQYQPEGPRPSQAPTGFATILVLQDTMLGILSLFIDTSQSVEFPGTSSGSQDRVGFIGIQ